MRRVQGDGLSTARQTGAVSCAACGVASIFTPGGATLSVAQIDQMGCRCLYRDARAKNVRMFQAPITATEIQKRHEEMEKQLGAPLPSYEKIRQYVESFGDCTCQFLRETCPNCNARYRTEELEE